MGERTPPQERHDRRTVPDTRVVELAAHFRRGIAAPTKNPTDTAKPPGRGVPSSGNDDDPGPAAA